jgi:translation initiation factor IF-3
VKEFKLKPNIDQHDLETKERHAREFLTKGNKVKVTMTFRGREMAHTEIGEAVAKKFCADLEDVSTLESPAKLLGRSLNIVLAPGGKKKPAKTTDTTTPSESTATGS